MEKTMRSKSLVAGIILMLISLLGGCTSFGPGAIQHSRTDYNVVLQKTSDEQLLLNLVRLRYRDRPLFLETSALTTQFKFSPSFSASIFDGENLGATGSLKGEMQFEEKPTVTYTPLQGKKFVQRVMSPVSWRTLELLDNVGWRSDRVLRVCVQQLNHLGNAITASGPTPKTAPPYTQFIAAAKLYHQLKSQNLVRSFKAKQGGRVVQMLEFDKTGKDSPQYQQLLELLGIDENQERVEVLLNNSVHLPGTLLVQTRSFAGILYFLSQSVVVPERDLDAGRVTITRDENGQVFDWTQVTQDLMRIPSSDTEPQNAAVKVHYRNSWFYIDDSDLESKSTFVLLGQLFALQSGNIQSTGPVLTLPVGN
jgi:hypothetical protein